MKHLNGMILFGFMAMLVAGTAASETLRAVFSLVSGKVVIQDVHGATRIAHSGSEAFEKETIVTEKDAKALLELFDGSTLELGPSTTAVIDSMERPAADEKDIRFFLDLGNLRAIVRKLMTPTSRFEVEAGGVICGVRGTQFTMDYDPALERLYLRVAEGTVYARTQGKTFLYHAGEGTEFLKGNPVPPEAQGGPVARMGPQAGLGIDGTEPLSLSLKDLNNQFVGGFSLGGGLGTHNVAGAILGLGGGTNLAVGGTPVNVTGIGILPLHLPLKLP